ncbi:hypothetical protein NP233_g10029 [Leucocoprinus birnbaumii]|uniref:Uncharacterized protein n=1 Tax=Leucocoprinus birnbaumii TaxID=56174 RepID=A0AAD5YSA1_9AGAR|nr:hypothetical protein NP233_g10029 [Leucocoprinus birnbaumii]
MTAARSQVIQPASGAQMCDHCHQKPRFGNHQYCSKTCAGLAATFCNQCHKKPKFQNFDYCGKHCASVAAANGAKQNRPAANSIGTIKKGASGNQQPAAGTIDPMQIAQLVAQHVPQIQSLLASAQGQGSSTSVSSTSQPNGAQPATQATTGIRSIPFFLRGMKKAKSKPNVSTKPSDDTKCAIPGCKQSVYVDDEGTLSEFCSLRHREEAVKSGLREPCIMCLVLPQSDTDYFCSKACLEESMNKQGDSEDEEEDESVTNQN